MSSHACAICSRQRTYSASMDSFRCAYCQRHEPTKRKRATVASEPPPPQTNHWDNVT